MTPRESRVWTYFIKKGGFMATCTACHRDYSYKASVGNLSKHWQNQHGKPNDRSDSSSDASDGEQEKNETNKKPMATWKFFDVVDSEKFEATCKICDKIVSYESVADLRRHVEDHGEMAIESEDEYQPSAQRRHVIKYARASSRRHSKLWKYFKIVDDKMATCLVCHGVFNYASTITNLRRHLINKHGEVDLSQDDEGKKMIVSANGQLYEFDTGPGHEDNDDDKLPMEMDTIYLEDFEVDAIDHEMPENLKKKQAKMTFKRDSSAEYLEMEHSKEPFEKDFTKEQVKKEECKRGRTKERFQREFSKEQFNRNFTKRFKRDSSKEHFNRSKERFQRDYSKERFQREYSKEQVKKNSDTCSEYSELPKPQTSSCTSMGSIDYFGQYVVSLLKELPKPVSDQLQNDIINQILIKKMALHSQTMAAKYEKAMDQNNETEVEITVPEPVSFAVVQSNEDPEKSNDATDSRAQE